MGEPVDILPVLRIGLTLNFRQFRVRWERMVEQSFFGNHIRNASLNNSPLHDAVVTNPHSSDSRNTISETNSSWALPPASLRRGCNVVTVVLVSNPPVFDVAL